MLLTAATAFILGWTVPLPLARRLLAWRGLGASHHTITTISHHDAPSSSGTVPVVRKAVCASTLVLYSLVLAWRRDSAPAPCLLLVAGGACMLCALACDMRARIVPWELCATLLVLGCLYELLTCGLHCLLATLCASGIIVAALCLARWLARLIGHGEPLGAGDVRLVPGLLTTCGLTGSAWGACACFAATGMGAACVLVRLLCSRCRRGRSTSTRHRARGPSGARGGQHGTRRGIRQTQERRKKKRDTHQTRGCRTNVRELAQSTAIPLAPGLCLWFAVGTLCV